jgi:Membrane domain of glycerophosphoryl diester phosphodiesterase
VSAPMTRLRPMGVGDLLDEVFGLYRRNFRLFVGIVAVLTIPQTIVSLIFALHSTAAVFVKHGPNNYSFHGDAFFQSLAFAVPSLVISILFAQLITAALARAISEKYLGHDVSVKQAYASIGMATLITLVLALLRLGITLIVGFFFLIIPFFYFLVRYAFITPVIVLEGTGVRKAFSRSAELVRGSWWRVFGILLLLVLIVAVIGFVLLFVLGAVLSRILVLNHSTGGIIWTQIISAIVGIFIQPIELATVVLLYYDLRIRKEGFDLEVAAENMGRPPRAV